MLYFDFINQVSDIFSLLTVFHNVLKNVVHLRRKRLGSATRQGSRRKVILRDTSYHTIAGNVDVLRGRGKHLDRLDKETKRLQQ